MDLKDIIYQNIQNDFTKLHFSGNLQNTTHKTPSGVSIPAKTYDMPYWKAKHVLVYDGRGSYAEEVNKEGSKYIDVKHPENNRKIGNHRGYIDNAVLDGVIEWAMGRKDIVEINFYYGG
jgi:hypothetical protein